MDFTKILKLSSQFEEVVFTKSAQQELNDAAIKKVVVDFYNEWGAAPPDDVRIQYQATGDVPSHHVQPKHYDVYVWSDSYLDPPADTTLQSRLHQAFDPNDELYNFYVKFFSE